MANGKATNDFTYKGKHYVKGDDVTIDAKHVERYEKLNYVKLAKEESKKAEGKKK